MRFEKKHFSEIIIIIIICSNDKRTFNKLKVFITIPCFVSFIMVNFF